MRRLLLTFILTTSISSEIIAFQPDSDAFKNARAGLRKAPPRAEGVASIDQQRNENLRKTQSAHQLGTSQSPAVHGDLAARVKELEGELALCQEQSGGGSKNRFAKMTEAQLMAEQKKSDAALKKEYEDLYHKFASGAIKPAEEKMMTQKLDFLEKQMSLPLTERRSFEAIHAEEKQKEQERIMAAKLQAAKREKDQQANKAKFEAQLLEDKNLHDKLRSKFSALDQASQNKVKAAYAREPLWKMLYLAQPGQESLFDVSGGFGPSYKTPFINGQYLRLFSLEELKAIRSFISNLEPTKAQYHKELLDNKITDLEGNPKAKALVAQGSIDRALVGRQAAPQSAQGGGTATPRRPLYGRAAAQAAQAGS